MVHPGLEPNWLDNKPSLLPIKPKRNTSKNQKYTTLNLTQFFLPKIKNPDMTWNEKESHWKNKPKTSRAALDLFFKDQNTKKGEKHLDQSWCHITILLPKKAKSKSKLHNTPNGLLSQLPLLQFSLWRTSARAMLRSLAEIIKSERISILMSRGYNDKLVGECCTVNKSFKLARPNREKDAAHWIATSTAYIC